MGKESQVEIPEDSGNLYRYQYDEGSGKTNYLGAVGNAPTLSEEEFLQEMDVVSVVGDFFYKRPRLRWESQNLVKSQILTKSWGEKSVAIEIEAIRYKGKVIGYTVTGREEDVDKDLITTTKFDAYGDGKGLTEKQAFDSARELMVNFDNKIR